MTRNRWLTLVFVAAAAVVCLGLVTSAVVGRELSTTSVSALPLTTAAQLAAAGALTTAGVLMARSSGREKREPPAWDGTGGHECLTSLVACD